MHPRTLSLFLTTQLAALLPAQGSPQLLSRNPAGQFGNGVNGRPVITPDGAWIAFGSHASDLVPGDVNGRADVILRNRQTGMVETVSVGIGGTGANGDSYACGISDDARFVCFSSVATNLVPNDTNNAYDLFVRDRSTGTTERVSVAPGGQQLPVASYFGSISGDGSTVAFYTTAAILPFDTNGIEDVYVRDRVTGAVSCASVSSAGVVGNASSFTPCLSADGRFVFFHGLASNLVPGDTNGGRDVFVHDQLLGTTERLSVGPGGVEGNGQSQQVACSADGRFVAFYSQASNLVANDTNANIDVFVHDRVAGVTERVSVDSNGAEGQGGILFVVPLPGISADGRHVLFTSALMLVPGQTMTAHVFDHDRQTGVTRLVSQNAQGQPGNSISGGGNLLFGGLTIRENVAIASNPPIAVFSSMANNLVAGDGNGAQDMFAVDLGLHASAPTAAPIGGTWTITLDAPSYPTTLFLTTFSPSSNLGFPLPGSSWLPLDFDPLLMATLGYLVTDAQGQASYGANLPNDPLLAGLQLHSAAVQLDLAGLNPFPTIGNVVVGVLQ